MLSRTSTQQFLRCLGLGCLSLLILLGGILYLSHAQGWINVWRLPIKPIAAFLGGAGLGNLMAAWLLGLSRRRLAWSGLIVLVILNGLAFVGAYGLTHFQPPGSSIPGMPRTVNMQKPSDVGLDYATQLIGAGSDEWLEAWYAPALDQAQGTVLLFPGNGGSKSLQLLAPAQIFHQLNYDALLIDFRGLGGSSGQTTTLGGKESRDVEIAFQHAEALALPKPYILYGVSMGSAAIMRAIAQNRITPDAIILELPFARLVSAVKSRLKAKRIPPSPAAELLVFWGSIQHGFNGFAHNPVAYAHHIDCPSLILQGEQDQWVTRAEIEAIAQGSSSQIAWFPTAGHQLLVTVDKSFWTSSVSRFLEGVRGGE